MPVSWYSRQLVLVWVQAPNGPCRHTCRGLDYPTMEGNPYLTESQPHKWYRHSLTDNGCVAKEEEGLTKKNNLISINYNS